MQLWLANAKGKRNENDARTLNRKTAVLTVATGVREHVRAACRMMPTLLLAALLPQKELHLPPWQGEVLPERQQQAGRTERVPAVKAVAAQPGNDPTNNGRFRSLPRPDFSFLLQWLRRRSGLDREHTTAR